MSPFLKSLFKNNCSKKLRQVELWCGKIYRCPCKPVRVRSLIAAFIKISPPVLPGEGMSTAIYFLRMCERNAIFHCPCTGWISDFLNTSSFSENDLFLLFHSHPVQRIPILITVPRLWYLSRKIPLQFISRLK